MINKTGLHRWSEPLKGHVGNCLNDRQFCKNKGCHIVKYRDTITNLPVFYEQDKRIDIAPPCSGTVEVSTQF